LIACGEDAYHGHLTGSALTAVIPHIVDVAGSAFAGTGSEALAAELCTAAGRVLQAAGDLWSARSWYERGLAIREKVLGPYHLDTAEGFDDLAGLLYLQREVGAARFIIERALAIRQRVLGHHRPDTAVTLELLAIYLEHEGDLVAARSLTQRAQTIQERVLGPQHDGTKTSFAALCDLLDRQGDLDAVDRLWNRFWIIGEEMRSPFKANNAGAQRRIEEEMDTFMIPFERIRAIREPGDPVAGPSLSELASAILATGQMSEARAVFERVLDVREEVLGPGHPKTATTLNDLALLHQAQGDLAAARHLFERALGIREHVLGPDHPETVATGRALAELAWDDCRSPADD